MPGPHLTLNFLAFSAIGLFALWGIVLTNGTLPALIEAVNDGFYPNGLRIHLRYTGIARVDHVLACLVAFFHIRVIAREGPPIMMVLEVAATLLVINLFILTESRRKDSRSCLKFPMIWACLNHVVGTAVVFPLFAMLYVGQGHRSGTRLINAAEAWALPVASIVTVPMLALLILPRLWFALSRRPHPSPEGQISILLFFLSPVLLVGTQTVLAAIIRNLSLPPSSSSSLTVTKSGTTAARCTQIAYLILGLLSATAHLVICYIARFIDNTKLSSVYLPHAHGPTILRGKQDIITKGALRFSQYDYIVTSVIIVILGLYVLLSERRLLAEAAKETSPASSNITTVMAASPYGSVCAFLATSAVLGPGTGLAFVAIRKEQFLVTLEKSHGQAGKGSSLAACSGSTVG
ncbi:uncharacterized protein PG998_000575 [Apiospora kogelbergensis]|uniref:uncharacterized protein n=1 Tax=Apiospora kogelbergensis TaxID=1337665 RepID=UPI00312FF63F